jgi:hypothetical protein
LDSTSTSRGNVRKKSSRMGETITERRINYV